MKIYTKTGDDGSTGLLGGQRVSKSDPRVDCVGEIDELNAAIGWAAVAADAELATKLRAIQGELFVIGSLLACPDAQPPAHLPTLEESSISRLEMEIDAVMGELSPLRNFILPGGVESSARLHLARSVCRRAERAVVGFSRDRPALITIITYLNRLSDWLFVHARRENQRAGVADVPWIP